MGPGERGGRGWEPGAGVDALGEHAGRGRGAAQVAIRRSAARRSPSAARLQAVQAVGAVQGSRPPSQLFGGDDAEAACSGRRVAAASGAPAGRAPVAGTGARAQAAAESSPEPGSPARRASVPRVPRISADGRLLRRRPRTSRRRRPVARSRRSRWRGSRRDRPPGSRRGRASGLRCDRRAAAPAARAAAATQPAASPWAARPGDRGAVAVEARRRVEVEAEQEAGDAPRLAAVARRGEAPSRRRRRRAARRRPSRRERPRRPRPCAGRSAPAAPAASARTSAAPNAAPRRRAAAPRGDPAPIAPEPRSSPPSERSDRPRACRRLGPRCRRTLVPGQVALPHRVGSPERDQRPPTCIRAVTPVSAGTLPAACRAVGLEIRPRPAGPGARRSTMSP